MLVLTRKINESVDLIDNRTGQRIGTVIILGMASNDTVRVGFDCPSHVRIERDNIKRRRSDGDGSKEEIDGNT